MERGNWDVRTSGLPRNVPFAWYAGYRNYRPKSSFRSAARAQTSQTVYVGRIVAVGLTESDRLCAMYRVSSRSFPNREIRKIGDALSVVPREGFESEGSQSPYVSYNCARVSGRFAVVGNGSHTDPIFEKLTDGVQSRDAIISTLFGMDYEHDALATPRIAGVIDSETRSSFLGVVRKNGLEVSKVNVPTGGYQYVSTYEHNYLAGGFGGSGFGVATAAEAADFILGRGIFESLSNAVSSAATLATSDGFEIGFSNDCPV